MNNSFLKNKSFYITPHNDIAEKLHTFIIANCTNISFNGYIDQKHGEQNININNIDSDVDYIFMISPNYYQEISITLKEHNIHTSKIIYVHKLNKFVFCRYQFFYKLLLLWSHINKIFTNSNYFYNKINFFLAETIGLKLFENEKKLSALKNKHQGKRAFILGNGPSLNIDDINSIKDEITFAANKIFLAFAETQWRPTYYCVEDNLVLLQNFEKINNYKESIKLFPNSLLRLKPPIDSSIYFNFHEQAFYPNFPKISNDPFKGLYWGSTIVFTMIQLAIFMGVKEIYLIGVDFNFTIPENSKNNLQELTYNNENNHFHKEYRQPGERWNVPNLHMQQKSFESIKLFCESNDIKIYNLSRETNLEVFNKANLDNIKFN